MKESFDFQKRGGKLLTIASLNRAADSEAFLGLAAPSDSVCTCQGKTLGMFSKENPKNQITPHLISHKGTVLAIFTQILKVGIVLRFFQPGIGLIPHHVHRLFQNLV